MKLSILIPSRSADYLHKTIEDILLHSTDATEIIVGLDGPQREIERIIHPRVTWLHESVSIGQRAITNKCADAASGMYLMKTDSHCSFGPGFDAILLEDMRAKTVLAPYLMPLDVETWTPRPSRRTSRYCFDTNLVMQYDKENDEMMPETMCLQGSCWMVAVSDYWDWNLGDESLGSWGGQGVELGIKAFLNGGQCVTTKNTYYAHMFKMKEEDFHYDRGPNPGKAATEELVRRYKNKSIAPLIEKFNFPCDWSVDKVNELAMV